jgi:hypothetical protein
MTENPYRGLDDANFWSRSHAGKQRHEIDPVLRGGFALKAGDRIATAGSCFAQHIARHLSEAGYDHLVTERAHPIFAPEIAAAHGYGQFSARYGNIYTARQLLQLARRAYGQFTPQEDVWQVSGGFVDPFRPTIQPSGFASLAEFRSARDEHFAAVRAMLETADVFIFTFGLTEAWRSRQDGAVFSLAPGVAGGSYDPDRHEFVNFTAAEVVADFRAFLDLARARNPGLKVIVTVSPVPLIATARQGESVITATAYSKAALRVACEELRQLPGVHYFPSYEIITSPHAGGAYFARDLREVTPEGVAHVMRLFLQHYAPDGGPARKPGADGPDFVAETEKSLAVICDEEEIARSVRGHRAARAAR